MLQVREGYLYVMYVMYLPDADGKVRYMYAYLSCIKKLQLADFRTFEHHHHYYLLVFSEITYA